MTPAERLLAAADLIETTGALARPWQGWAAAARRSDYDRDDAAWIALLGPDTAPALATWLRREAHDGNGAEFPEALAFAEQVLRNAGGDA